MIINISCQPRSQYCEFIKVSLMSKLNNYNIIGVCCPVITFNFRDLHQMVIEKLHLAPGGGGHSTGGCWSSCALEDAATAATLGNCCRQLCPTLPLATSGPLPAGVTAVESESCCLCEMRSPWQPRLARHPHTGTSHCLPMATVSSCPAGRWRMLSLTRFMKTAAPDHAADLTRYTLVQ